MATAMSVTGLPADKVTVHTTFLGGGLGRKVELDYVRQALLAAKAVPGTPVKLTWSREDDFTHDFYRPAALCKLQGGVDAAGNVTGLVSRVVSPSIAYQRGPARFADPTAVDSSAVEGLNTLPYGLANQRVEWIRDTAQVPVGYWRSVGNSHNVFFAECFLDELAAAGKRDPVELRRSMLGNNARARTVLDTVAPEERLVERRSAAGGHAAWRSCQCFGSIVGEVVEVSRIADERARDEGHGRDRLWRARSTPTRCGRRSRARSCRGSRRRSGATCRSRPASRCGRTSTQFRLGQLKEAPPIDITIIESGAPLGGVGEPRCRRSRPALVNAMGEARPGPRRTLPLFPQAVPTTS